MKIISIVGTRPQFLKMIALSMEFEKHSNCNLGVLCGGLHNLVAVDIDVFDQACANELEKLMTEELGYAPKRVWKAPKLLLLYRCTERREKKQTAEYTERGLFSIG